MTAPAKASKNYNVAFIQGVAGDEFYITMQCGAEAEAAKLGVTVTTQGPQKFDPTLQKPILDSVMAAKPDAMLIAPTDVTAMQDPLEQAAEAGTKVVLVDTTTEDPRYATSAIASDNEGGGKAAFDAIKQLNPDGGKVMVMSIDPGISTIDARVKGFEDAVESRLRRSPTSACSTRTTTRPPRPTSMGSPCRRTPTSSVSSPPTCSPRRARRPACARPARRTSQGRQLRRRARTR